MSKLGDVQKMYGQDFGITVTNAPSSIIKSSSNLPKNMLLISSYFINGEDDGYPSLFATDYNGSPVQLTYAAYTGYNGLIVDNQNRLSIYIDNKTIKSGNNLPLSVDSDELAFASQDKRGVVKVGNNLSQDDQRNINIEEEQEFNYDDEGNIKFDFEKTGIDIDSTGSLIISDSFIKYFKAYIEEYISKKALPLAERYKDSSPELNNLQGDINTGIYGANEEENLNILKPGLNSLYLNSLPSKDDQGLYNQGYIKLNADLSFFSTSKTPISNIVISCSGADVIQNKTETNLIKEDNEVRPYINLKNYKLYQHELTDIQFIFPPNYTFINNVPQEKMYNINISGLNTSAFTIYQNKLTSSEFYFELNNTRNSFTYKPSTTDDETPILDKIRYPFTFNYIGLMNLSNKIDLQYELKIYLSKTDSIILYDKILDLSQITTNSNSNSLSVIENIKDISTSAIDQLIKRSVQANGSSITIKSDAPKDGYCDLIITTNGEKSIIQNTFIVDHIRDISNVISITLSWAITSITVSSSEGINITQTISGGDLSSISSNTAFLDALLKDKFTNSIKYDIKFKRNDAFDLDDIQDNIKRVLYGSNQQNYKISGNNLSFTSSDNLNENNIFNSISIELKGNKYSLSIESQDLQDINKCIRNRVRSTDIIWLTRHEDGTKELDDPNLQNNTNSLTQNKVYLYFNPDLIKLGNLTIIGNSADIISYNNYYEIPLLEGSKTSLKFDILIKDSDPSITSSSITSMEFELPAYVLGASARDIIIDDENNTGDDENDQVNAREGNFDDDIQDDELS